MILEPEVDLSEVVYFVVYLTPRYVELVQIEFLDVEEINCLICGLKINVIVIYSCESVVSETIAAISENIRIQTNTFEPFLFLKCRRFIPFMKVRLEFHTHQSNLLAFPPFIYFIKRSALYSPCFLLISQAVVMACIYSDNYEGVILAHILGVVTTI